MSTRPSLVPQSVVELRRAFDQAFASAPGEQAPEAEDILSLRIAGKPYGVKVHEIAGIARVSRIVPLPSSTPGLLGIVQIRGTLVPVYSLSIILGHPQASPGPACWVALHGRHDPVALDLGEFKACIRVLKSELCSPEDGTAGRRHIGQVARTPTGVRAIIDVVSVVESIKRQTRRIEGIRA